MASVRRVRILIVVIKGQFTHASCSSPASIERDDNKRKDFELKEKKSFFSTDEAH